ncbi:MAG: hypothetical protein RLP09_21580 [Sandaracinaceae bacterium]
MKNLPWCALALLSACAPVSKITPVHQPRAALLDHAGELRAQVGIGATIQHGPSVTASVVGAPAEGLLLAGGVDLDPGSGETSHYAADLAIGAFLPDQDALRLEGFVGLGAGTARGFGEYWDDDFTVVARADLEGPYLRPYGQISIGFEVPYYEMSFGAQVWGTLIDLRVEDAVGAVRRTGYERMGVMPFVTTAFLIESFRIESTFGMSLYVAGEVAPQGLGVELNNADVVAQVRLGYEVDLAAPRP